MKKTIVSIIFSILLIPTIVNASNTYVINSKASTSKSCSIKTQPNEKGDYVSPGYIHWLDPNDQVTIIDSVSPVKSTVSNCSSSYYYVNYSGYKGYVCGDYINFNASGKYDSEFKNAGFPQSYWLSLNSLKESHPNWVFTAYQTGLNWEDAITAESTVEYNSNTKKYWSRNYIQSTNALYLSKATGSYTTSTKKYTMMETGSWYAVNKGTVAYYMDPRNFLNDRDIFMFETGYSNQTRQTKTVLNKMFSSNAHAAYTDYFYEAATSGGNNISSTMLGARSRLEVGGQVLSASASGSSGYYNFYNIGSLSSCSNPVACGSNFAAGKGWTSARTAIIGGAAFIYNSYVQRQQGPIYFQKFNTTTNGYRYANQYMTNIQAPKTEANMIYNAYNNGGTLNLKTEFIIPVYNNMPTSAVNLPTTEEQEPTTSNQTTNTVAISTMITKAGYKYSGNYLSNIKIGTTAATFISKLKNAGATVTVKTTNSSGVTKTISSSETLGTGDTITISNGTNSGTYRVIINGDTNGDGKIAASDYVKIKNHIMGKSSLSGSYVKAADVNGDGNVAASDYVKVKNYIMGKGSL